MAQDELFEYGDRTMFQLRNQSFMADEFGTMVSVPTTPAMTTAVEVAPEEDPMKRLEQKLDAALHAIAALQQRVESLDATIARAINR